MICPQVSIFFSQATATSVALFLPDLNFVYCESKEIIGPETD